MKCMNIKNNLSQITAIFSNYQKTRWNSADSIHNVNFCGLSPSFLFSAFMFLSCYSNRFATWFAIVLLVVFCVSVGFRCSVFMVLLLLLNMHCLQYDLVTPGYDGDLCVPVCCPKHLSIYWQNVFFRNFRTLQISDERLTTTKHLLPSRLLLMFAW